MKKSDRTKKRVDELVLALKLVDLQEEMEKEDQLWIGSSPRTEDRKKKKPREGRSDGI